MDRERELKIVEFPTIIVGSCQICGCLCPDLPAAAALVALETPNSQAPASHYYGSKDLLDVPGPGETFWWVIHKILEIVIDLNLDSCYIVIRNRI